VQKEPSRSGAFLCVFSGFHVFVMLSVFGVRRRENVQGCFGGICLCNVETLCCLDWQRFTGVYAKKSGVGSKKPAVGAKKPKVGPRYAHVMHAFSFSGISKSNSCRPRLCIPKIADDGSLKGHGHVCARMPHAFAG